MNTSRMSLHNGLVTFEIHSGWGADNKTFLGATFDTQLSPNMRVEHVHERIPNGGLHAMIFEVRYAKEHQSFQDDLVLMLFWGDVGGKIFGKLSEELSAEDLGRFELFGIMGNTLVVADTERKIRYTSAKLKPTSGWTNKFVPIESLLQFICKRLTFEDLEKVSQWEETALNLMDWIWQLVDKHALYQDEVWALEKDLNDGRADLAFVEVQIKKFMGANTPE